MYWLSAESLSTMCEESSMSKMSEAISMVSNEWGIETIVDDG